ncbi:unnamed protein product [Prorocentrum cordatum]|uniref:Poly(A) RNA polymerase mitochondrial-like central palm domain-containing protein n=1 Tax=Prorocentrum cordatum TaxID=2364126 RepID=A0ABN9SZ54_9DINO|nr:unnamed protein product [Polarella glacialis]
MVLTSHKAQYKCCPELWQAVHEVHNFERPSPDVLKTLVNSFGIQLEKANGLFCSPLMEAHFKWQSANIVHKVKRMESVCSLCLEEFAEGTPMRLCRTCDFEVCHGCVATGSDGAGSDGAGGSGASSGAERPAKVQAAPESAPARGTACRAQWQPSSAWGGEDIVGPDGEIYEVFYPKAHEDDELEGPDGMSTQLPGSPQDLELVEEFETWQPVVDWVSTEAEVRIAAMVEHMSRQAVSSYPARHALFETVKAATEEALGDHFDSFALVGSTAMRIDTPDSDLDAVAFTKDAAGSPEPRDALRLVAERLEEREGGQLGLQLVPCARVPVLTVLSADGTQSLDLTVNETVGLWHVWRPKRGPRRWWPARRSRTPPPGWSAPAWRPRSGRSTLPPRTRSSPTDSLVRRRLRPGECSRRWGLSGRARGPGSGSRSWARRATARSCARRRRSRRSRSRGSSHSSGPSALLRSDFQSAVSSPRTLGASCRRSGPRSARSHRSRTGLPRCSNTSAPSPSSIWTERRWSRWSSKPSPAGKRHLRGVFKRGPAVLDALRWGTLSPALGSWSARSPCHRGLRLRSHELRCLTDLSVPGPLAGVQDARRLARELRDLLDHLHRRYEATSHFCPVSDADGGPAPGFDGRGPAEGIGSQRRARGGVTRKGFALCRRPPVSGIGTCKS